MTDLKTIIAANVEGQDVTLRDFFQVLHLKGMLRPMLREVVTDSVVTAAAQKEGLTVSKEELQKATDAFRARRRLNKADDTKQWLGRNRMSQEDLESSLQRAILQRKMIAGLTNGNGNIEKQFNENRTRFDRAHISRIVVGDENLANELKTQIAEDGGDFHQLAREHTIDKRSPGAGGRPVWIPCRRLPQNIAQAVVSAKPGQVAGPFQVGNTWHLIRVHNIRRGELNARTAAIIRRQIFRQWLRDRLQQAKVELKLPEYMAE